MPKGQDKVGDGSRTGLSHLRVTFDAGFYMGPGRADLLELIGETGSISQAARHMGMSYKRAWSLVQEMNAGFGAALVLSLRGGKDQGATLTPAGQELVRRYRAMQAAAREAISKDFEAVVTLRTDMSIEK